MGDQETVISEARYRAIVDTAVDAIIVIDELGTLNAFNPAAEGLFGYSAHEVLGRNIKMLMPEPDHSGHDGYLSRYRDTGERRIIGIGREVEGLRKDGVKVPLELSVAEWHSGETRYFTGVMRDISERRRAAAQQSLLVNELNHRVKNSLTTVQAVVHQSLRNAADLDAAQHTITARLLALAQAHDVLTLESWEGADIRAIVEGALAGHAPLSRIKLAGPDIRLTPRASLALSMALHELCTNAVKYGALSNEDGHVAVSWRQSGPERAFGLMWVERGGPPVTAPTRRGFGTRMLQGLAREIGGEARLEFAREGLTCDIHAVSKPYRRAHGPSHAV